MSRNPSHRTYERRWNETSRLLTSPAVKRPERRYTDEEIMAMPWGKADKTRALKANALERDRQRVRELLAQESGLR